jgi:hypothetical protein
VVYDLEGVLGPSIVAFVDRHVRSLLTWDVLAFFNRNPDAVFDVGGLSSRLGRRPEELQPELESLIDSGILDDPGGLIRYRPAEEMRRAVAHLMACFQHRTRRLAIIALVLRGIGPHRPQ